MQCCSTNCTAFTSIRETSHHAPLFVSLLLRLLQNGTLLRRERWMCTELWLRQREESPEVFSNGTANRPTERALLSPRIQQIVVRVDNLLVVREIVPSPALIPFTDILRVEENQRFRIGSKGAIRSRDPAMQQPQQKADILPQLPLTPSAKPLDLIPPL